jgi:serine/threonine protein kinase
MAEAAELLGEREAGGMVGRTLGHYQLRSLIGAGGMGKVYRAIDTWLEREVAVKILPAHLEQDAEALHRFEGETKAVAALSLSIAVTAIQDPQRLRTAGPDFRLAREKL